MKKEEKKLLNNIHWIYNSIFIFLMLMIFVFSTFEFEIIHIITPFIYMPIAKVFTAINIVIIVIELIRTIMSFIKKKKNHFINNFILLIISFLIFILPTSIYYENIRFKLNIKNFNYVAEDLSNTGDEDNYLLPKEYRYLSRGGGQVVITEKIVIFYSYRGVLDNYSIYAYVPDEESYNTLKEYNDWAIIEKVAKNWYFCISI